MTRTDVAQAEARRSDSITQLYAAQANLKTSRATYEVVIGHPPSNLVHPPSIVHLLPSQLEDAMTLGDGQNPFILAAVYQEEASLYNVEQIEGELLPEATLDVQYSQRFGLSHTLKEQQVTTVMGRVNVPLYQGGGVAARIRQAKETNNQLKKEVEDARLRIHAEVIANWAQLQATASEIQSAQDALEANRIALEGVREEEKVGQRTTLDVLNAELEYLGSQIQLVTAKRDRVVAEYALYGSVGRHGRTKPRIISALLRSDSSIMISLKTSGSGSDRRLRRLPTSESSLRVKVTIIKRCPNQTETCTLTVC